MCFRYLVGFARLGIVGALSNKRLKLAARCRLWNESFFSAPRLKRTPLGGTRRTRSDGVRILVLGGTLFLGRHIVEAALARGHDVVLFNRGKHNPHLFSHIEKLRGDRDGDLVALSGRRLHPVVRNGRFNSSTCVISLIGACGEPSSAVSESSTPSALDPR